MNFKSNLTKIIKQYSVFYTFLFFKNPADSLPEQTYPKLKPIKINDDDDEKYKINNIINIKITKKIIKAQIKFKK